MTSYVILALVVLAAALAARAVWKDHKAGKACSCGGDCAHCKGCH